MHKKALLKQAEAQKKTVEDILNDFRENKLQGFITENFGKLNEDERKALTLIFNFYSNPGTRTALQHRMSLEPS